MIERTKIGRAVSELNQTTPFEKEISNDNEYEVHEISSKRTNVKLYEDQ